MVHNNAGFARPPTDRALFHAHTTHLATGALLLPGHMSGTASQHTCATKTLLTTVSGVNLRRRILGLMLLPGRNATSCLTAL